MIDKEKLPDCEDISQLSAPVLVTPDIEAMATRRANTACGDNRKGKAMYVMGALRDLIHHEAKSAYLAGYSQAMKDLEKP